MTVCTLYETPLFPLLEHFAAFALIVWASEGCLGHVFCSHSFSRHENLQHLGCLSIMFSLLYKTTTCIAFLLFLTWYGQTHFYRDPGSVFFDKARAYQTTYSTIRRAEAEQTIGSLSTGRSPETSDVPSRNKTLCVALNSVARQTQYLPVIIPLSQPLLLADVMQPPDNCWKHSKRPVKARARRP